jgi:hypothetical protein
MGDYGFPGAGEFGGMDTNFNCGIPDSILKEIESTKSKVKIDEHVSISLEFSTKDKLNTFIERLNKEKEFPSLYEAYNAENNVIKLKLKESKLNRLLYYYKQIAYEMF